MKDEQRELVELREYIWERCQADDHDTDEVMAKVMEWHEKRLEPLRKVWETTKDFGHLIPKDSKSYELWQAIKQVLEPDLSR